MRKVSSYELSKSRDRAGGKVQTERNSSLSRDRGNADLRYIVLRFHTIHMMTSAE